MEKKRLVALAYHELCPNDAEGDIFSICSSDFLAQMDLLRSAGGEVADPLRFLGEGPEKQEGRILITFDDGHKSHLTVARLMADRFGFRGLFFVCPGLAGHGSPWLCPKEIRELQGLGCTVQSHGNRHVFLGDLNDRDLRAELSDAKNNLEDILGKEITALSFPGGRYRRRTLIVAREIGFRTFFTSRPQGWEARMPDGSRIVHRYLLRRGIGKERYMRLVQGRSAGFAYSDFSYFLKCGMQRIVGNERYQLIWEMRERLGGRRATY